MNKLTILILFAFLTLFSCEQDNTDVFRPDSNGQITLEIKNIDSGYLGVYSFPQRLESYEIQEGIPLSIPLYFPTSEVYLKIDERDYRLFLVPNDTIVIKDINHGLIVEKSSLREINQYYLSSKTYSSANVYASTDTLNPEETAEFMANWEKDQKSNLENKDLPKWFYSYETARIRSESLFQLLYKTHMNKADSILQKTFEKNFDNHDAFSPYQYSNYTNIMMYLDCFNSSNLLKKRQNAQSLFVGLDEKTAQTLKYLPQQYHDINLATQINFHIENGLLNHETLPKYKTLFKNEEWFKVLQKRLPNKSEMLTERHELPYFYLPSLNGEYFESSQLKGKYTYINFWSFWCKPCLEKFPIQNQLAEEHPEINHVNICLDADSLKWQKFTQSRISIQSINLWANDGWSQKLKDKYNVLALPKAILVDKEGLVAIPTPPLSKTELDSILESLN